MTDAPEDVLQACWRPGEVRGQERTCRCCHQGESQGHDPECPCGALDLALQQRDALATYTKAEKRNWMLQSAVRLARKSGRSEVKERLDRSALELEAAHARLRELGIDDKVR